MVKLRLTRLGRKNQPVYRVVAIDSRKQRDGKFIEQIGTYDVMSKKIKFDFEKALYWLKVGAKPSETVKSLLKKEGIWKEFINKKIKKV